MPPKLFAMVEGAILVADGFPCPWGWLLVRFGAVGAPCPGVIPSSTPLIALVHIGAGGPGAGETLVEIVASTIFVPSNCPWRG